MQTPVLFIIFNRLDTTQKVFEQIKKAAPSRLFIAADGPRASKQGEHIICEQVRKWVLANIDWDCKVETLFRENNLGCGKAVSQAITWFFDNVEMGIILEDDCLPDSSFFSFCTNLLDRYKDNSQIMHISGTNPLGNMPCIKNSYYFTKIEHCWGWASWKRAWEKFSLEIIDFDSFMSKKILNSIFIRKNTINYWIDIFNKMTNNQIDSWAYPWTYAILKNDGLSINPSKNLVTNIGFVKNATHTTNVNSKEANMPKYSISIIKHPNKIYYNKLLAERIAWSNFGIRFNIKHMIKKLLKRALRINR